MTLYKPKASVTVQAIQLTDIQLLVNWLFANYAGHFSIEADHDPQSIFLAVDTPSGRVHALPNQWVVARGTLPATQLDVLPDSVFLATYDLV